MGATWGGSVVRSNRVGSGSEVLQEKLSRGEVYELQNKDGIKLIMWKDKKKTS